MTLLSSDEIREIIMDLRSEGHECKEFSLRGDVEYTINLGDKLVLTIHFFLGKCTFPTQDIYISKMITSDSRLHCVSNRMGIHNPEPYNEYRSIENVMPCYDNRITFDVCGSEDNRNIHTFEGLHSMGIVVSHPRLTKYTAEYEHFDLLQIRLSNYTKNETILKYFSENPFVK